MMSRLASKCSCSNERVCSPDCFCMANLGQSSSSLCGIACAKNVHPAIDTCPVPGALAQASALREELSELRQQHVRSESELRQAIGEKTNAMSRLSAAEASAEQGFAELGERLDEIANLKSTLQKVRLINHSLSSALLTCASTMVQQDCTCCSVRSFKRAHRGS